MELCEFVGDQEPEFEGAVYGAASVQTDVWNPALNGVVQARRVLLQSGGFEREQCGTHGRGQARGHGERGRDGIVVFSIGSFVVRERSAGRLKGLAEVVEEFVEPARVNVMPAHGVRERREGSNEVLEFWSFGVLEGRPAYVCLVLHRFCFVGCLFLHLRERI